MVDHIQRAIDSDPWRRVSSGTNRLAVSRYKDGIGFHNIGRWRTVRPEYPVGREPWTLEEISRKTWQHKQRVARMTPSELDGYRERTLATARAASARYKAKLRLSRPSRRATNANPVPGVNTYDRWHGKGAALKGRKRPPRGLNTTSRAVWLCARSARRSLALRAALEDGSWSEWMTRDPEFGHDAILVTEKQVA